MLNILLIACLSLSRLSISSVEQTEVIRAIELLKRQQHIFENAKTAYGRDALSVVFPEVVRYVEFKDFFETKALQALYVRYGKSAADFSIGLFQMKPSFIEDLENAVEASSHLPDWFPKILNYPPDATESEIRKIRVERLQSPVWQWKYARSFFLLAEETFCDIYFEGDTDRIRFYAAAYNYGFLKPEADIRKWMGVKAFPYGKKFRGKQEAYADMAARFYQTYYFELFDHSPQNKIAYRR